jgi:large subunit ribosomal protein L15
MRMDDLQPAYGSRPSRRRVGRGHGSGRGTTAGRGTKGQKARTGGQVRPRFEGGQLSLSLRLPHKRGFHNRYAVEYQEVNLRGLADLAAGTRVDADVMAGIGLIKSLDRPVKILGVGELNSALVVVADKFTAGAKAKIEAAGGQAILTKAGESTESPGQEA